MPNWCYNIITFASKEDAIKAFRDFNPKIAINTSNISELSDFSFEMITPVPKTKEECIEKYGAEFIDDGNNSLEHSEEDSWFNWWKWRNRFWGTKWDCGEVMQQDNSVYFHCPWAPPEPIFDAMSKKTAVPFMVAYAEEQGAVICGHYYHNWDDKEGLFMDTADSDEAYETYNEVEGETYYKLEDGKYHGDWEDDVFVDSNGDLHFYDIENPNIETAKELHKEYGKDFDDFLVANLEETDPAFLKDSIGFVRPILNFDEVRDNNYIVDFKE